MSILKKVPVDSAVFSGYNGIGVKQIAVATKKSVEEVSAVIKKREFVLV